MDTLCDKISAFCPPDHGFSAAVSSRHHIFLQWRLLMSDLTDLVARYYDEDPQHEWERLDRHRTEYALTWKALDNILPPPPARILDCGGGPGRYAIELARGGFAVTLFDLSPASLRLARVKAAEAGVELEAFELGSAVDLSRFGSSSFDAVLLMGPLYHLLENSGQRQAIQECVRLIKPGGVLVTSFICRYAGLRRLAMTDPAGIISMAPFVDEIMRTGRLLPRQENSPEFIAQFTHPNEISDLMWDAGMELRQLLGLEGLVSLIEERINQSEPEVLERWIELNNAVAQDPTTWGGVEHLLAVAVKPAWKYVLRQIAGKMKNAGVSFKVVGGTSAALHGVRLPVKDIDLEMEGESAYRFQELFPDQVVQAVSFAESPSYRSHFGIFDFDGVKVDVSGDLERKEREDWAPTRARTFEMIDLEGDEIPVSWLEEEFLAYIRRDRLERAGQCLAKCDRQRLLSLLRGQIEVGVI
jgi:S-adenosylmethionine-dependent methyltransferase